MKDMDDNAKRWVRACDLQTRVEMKRSKLRMAYAHGLDRYGRMELMNEIDALEKESIELIRSVDVSKLPLNIGC